jgi:hypothetical protein
VRDVLPSVELRRRAVVKIDGGHCRTCGAWQGKKTLRLIAIKLLSNNADTDMLKELLPRCSPCVKRTLRRRAEGARA